MKIHDVFYTLHPWLTLWTALAWFLRSRETRKNPEAVAQRYRYLKDFPKKLVKLPVKHVPETKKDSRIGFFKQILWHSPEQLLPITATNERIYPFDTGRKLNDYKTLRRRLQKALCTQFTPCFQGVKSYYVSDLK